MRRSAEVLLVLLLAGCSSPTRDLPDPAPLTGMVDVRVDVIPQTEHLRWSLATQEIQPCGNYSIATRTLTMADPWIVYVDGIRTGGLCDNTVGPARMELDLGPVRPGTHRFRVVVGEGIGQGFLEVTADSIFVDYAGPCLHFVETAVPRVPPVELTKTAQTGARSPS